MENLNVKNVYGINTPQTEVEFRENLRKYFVCLGNKLYVQEGNGVVVDNLNSLTDLYNLCDGTPSITVKVHLKKDFRTNKEGS